MKFKDKNNTLAIYLKEIHTIKMLERDEEEKVAREAVKGNQEAKHRLITANLRFVVNIAKKYQNQGLSLEDLIAEGNFGLIHAIEKFDPEKKYHFISYAVWWIRQSILKAICEKSRMIRLPLNRANELVQIEKAKKGLKGSYTDEEGLQELAKELNMSKEHIESLLNITRDYISLETTITSEKNSSTRADFIEDKSMYARPEEVTMENFLREETIKFIDRLPKKDAEIVKYRYGIDNYPSLPLKEIGIKFKLTKERIRQIEKKSLKTLREMEVCETIRERYEWGTPKVKVEKTSK